MYIDFFFHYITLFVDFLKIFLFCVILFMEKKTELFVFIILLCVCVYVCVCVCACHLKSDNERDN